MGSLEEVAASSFHLASSFPRVVFAGEKLRASLLELGLAPQAALLVQAVDDDDE